ncbi:ATP-binding cassette domain-containing protein [Streptomyces monticola]|uniref:ATP-binding cassette domain-containing protein n=1 Tax=Streptomyces monticola TaxID=2666263 RepID=A0ABW2JPS2_9ACTN
MRSWHGGRAALGLLWRAGPWHTVALGGVVVCGAATAALTIVATGWLVGALPGVVASGATGDDTRQLVLALTLFAALAVARTALRALESGLSAVLRLRAAGAVEDRAMAAALAPDSIAHLEEPAYADTLRLATEPATRADQLASLLPEVVRPRLEGIALLGLLASLAWWAPLLLGAAAALTYRSNLRLARSVHGSMEAASAVLRRSGYFRSLAVDPEPAKEIRVFGLAEWVAEQMTAVWQSGMAKVWATRRSASGRAFGAVGFVVLAEGLVLGYAAWSATHAGLALAPLVIVVQAALAVPALGWVGDPDLSVRDALLGLRSLTALEGRSREQRGREYPEAAAQDRPGGGLRGEIVFDSVSFGYPRADNPVLRGLDLRIPAGASVAIVGANGCGKTTLVKLLARLYEPDAGRITLDGVDARSCTARQWRAGLSVVFQDFVKYPLTLRDNITALRPQEPYGQAEFGQAESGEHEFGQHEFGQGELERALALADGSALPGGLPRGWDTVLSRQFEGGADLSAGQWQKVALARALLAARAGSVLVLDEPTAHLDARAEAAFFERFLTVTRGATTLLISHRFSGVRKADLIHVLDGGRIVESGTHAELLARGGRYARMYRLQAARFTEEDHAASPPDRASAATPRRPVTRPADDAPDTGPDTGHDPGPGAELGTELGVKHGVLKALRTLVGGAFRESWKLAALGLLLVPAAAGLAALQALWLRSLAEGAQLQDSARTATAALLLVLSLGVWQAVELAGATARVGLSERVGFAFDRLLARLAAGIAGLRHHEEPAFQDRLHLLRSRTLAIGALLNWLLNLLEQLGGFLVTAVLLATVHPALLALPLVGAAALRLQVAARAIGARAQEATAADYRLAVRLTRLATSAAAAKELRIFDGGTQLRSRAQELRKGGNAVLGRSQWRIAALGGIGGLLNTLGLVGAVAFVAHQAAEGRTGLGAVLLAVVLAGRFTGHAAGLVQSAGAVADLMQSAERLHWLRSYAHRVRPAAATAEVPAALRHGLTLDGLGFRYPGTRRAALHAIDLHVPAGAVVAVVGANGSGKSTLVKLLCRVYEPTRGRIAVDGTPLTALDTDGWRRQLAAGFEDFVRFELLARTTVGVGDLPRLDDPQAVRGALARAGAAELPGALAHGLDTQLGSQWPGGIDLSTGQWQKLTLGRALMREAPLLRILDEPTASLDAETEHALFERFVTAARDPGTAGGHGTITLLVSHRFSTVRSADLIVVLDEGRLIETGHHEELLARGGLYAQMYELQARAYR